MNSSLIRNIYDILSTDANAAIFPGYLNELAKFRLWRMVEHASVTSPFYRKKYKKFISSQTPFNLFPISNKSEMMSHFDQCVTDQNIKLADIQEFISIPANIGKPFKNKYYVWQSSGTNGLQGVYIQDKKCINRYQAIEAMRKPITNICTQYTYQALGQERIAYIGVLDQHYASTVSLAILKDDFPNLKKAVKNFSIFEPIEQVVYKLTSYDPTVIITYPSMAICLADNPSIHLRPREIWLGGEQLSIEQRNYIERALKTKIYCSYGASEFLPIAWQCSQGGLHVNSDWVLLEAVDENYLPIPDGKLSHTSLLTNLANNIQPIIRYDLGDQICFSPEKCICGSIFPHIQIVGRASDYLKFVNLNGKKVKVPVLAIIALIEVLGIFNATISQINTPTENHNDSLCIEFLERPTPSKKKIKAIEHSIQQYLAKNHIGGISILCKNITQKHMESSGKHPLYLKKLLGKISNIDFYE